MAGRAGVGDGAGSAWISGSSNLDMWGRDSPPDHADDDMEGKEPSSKAEPQSLRGISNDESLFDEIRAEHLVNRSRGIRGLLLFSEESEAEGRRSSMQPSQGLCPGGASAQDKSAYSQEDKVHIRIHNKTTYHPLFHRRDLLLRFTTLRSEYPPHAKISERRPFNVDVPWMRM